MEVQPLQIPDVLLIRPRVHGDARGFFQEIWNQESHGRLGVAESFVQLNHSRSGYGTLRGLHFQWRHPQGKLVRVLAGEVFDVAVDLRPGSPTFGRWAGHRLSAESREQLWIPERFAHGFLVLSASADFEYLCTRLYHAADEAALRWDDPALGIPWPLAAPLLSERDRAAPPLAGLRERLEREWGA